MQQITVTIGRNVGTAPMSEMLWDYFKRDVAVALYANLEFVKGHSDVEVHEGIGMWEGEQEQSAKLSVRNRDHRVVSMNKLKTSLAEIAHLYSQDAICLSIGNSELITPPRLDQGVAPLRATSHVNGYRGEVTR